MIFRLSLLIMSLVTLNFLLACGSDPTPIPSQPPAPSIATVMPDATSSDSGSLVVYSGRSESLVAPLIETFAESSGIDVKVKYGKTAELASTLLEESSNSPADVFYAQDPGGLGAVESLLSNLPGPTRELAPEWAKSPSGLWIGVSGRARVLVYNPENLKEADLPKDLESLTDPKWKGKLGWAPTNGSLLTMVTGLRSEWGDARTLEWVKGLVDNDINIFPKNTPQVAAVAAGEIDIGLVNHYYLYRFIAEEGDEFSARNYHLPNGGPGSLVMVSGAGVLKTAENNENAIKFINFLLSPVAQSYFANQTYEYPLIDGVKTHRLLTPLEDVVQPDIKLSELSDLEGTVELLRSGGALP